MMELRRTTSVASWLMTLPAIGTALLPRFACPCTLPAYAGLISSMGLGFLMQTSYLLPLTVLTLTLALGALGFRANRRWGYGPFFVGIVAAGGMVFGKFAIASDPAVYVSTAALVGASICNAWPKRAKTGASSAPSAVPNREHRGGEEMTKRDIKVFSAGCPACDVTAEFVRRLACPSCDVSILDMKDAKVAQRASTLGIRSVPAVVVDGKLAACCQGGGPDETTLRAAGLGVT